MLEIQVEQLSAEEQKVLEGSSVAGERFSVWAIAAMIETSAESIEGACEQTGAAGNSLYGSWGSIRQRMGPIQRITNSDTPSTGRLSIGGFRE